MQNINLTDETLLSKGSPTMTRILITASFFVGCLIGIHLHAQTSPNIQEVSIKNDGNFQGFDLIEETDNQLFVLSEHWHNIKSVPQATFKILQHLHRTANIRILAIEQGTSAAMMINQYLKSGDTTILRKIVRNTMFWGKENYAFFQELYRYNQAMAASERIVVKSIDIEYKMESAIYMVNQLIGPQEIPESLNTTLGLFKSMFDETRSHREQFDGLAVMYYYDKEIVEQLVAYTLSDIQQRKTIYQSFLKGNFGDFAQMIQDMSDGLYFDYTNPNTHYKFRDKLIYEKFNKLIEENPHTGILCVIGMRHTSKGSSIHSLDILKDSPVQNSVLNIRITALLNNKLNAADLRRLNFAYPQQLKKNAATLIKHDPSDQTLESKKFDYTLFINQSGNLTPFENILKENY